MLGDGKKKPKLGVLLAVGEGKPSDSGDKPESGGDYDHEACIEKMQDFIRAVKDGDAEAAHEAFMAYDALEKKSEATEEEDEAATGEE